MNIAVLNLVIPLVNGGYREARDLLIKISRGAFTGEPVLFH